MIIWKKLEIDLDEERARIRSCFNREERSWLLTLVDLFERGFFKECLCMVDEASRVRREFINEKIWGVLWDMTSGYVYKTEPVEFDIMKLMKPVVRPKKPVKRKIEKPVPPPPPPPPPINQPWKRR